MTRAADKIEWILLVVLAVGAVGVFAWLDRLQQADPHSGAFDPSVDRSVPQAATEAPPAPVQRAPHG